MEKHAHGDARRPDGDLVNSVPPYDSRTDAPPREFGPKVGLGHDAVFLPPTPDDADDAMPGDEPADDDGPRPRSTGT